MLKKYLTIAFICLFSSLSAADSLLYLIHAKEGIYFNGKLTLKEVSPGVSYFSRGPNRQAGILSIRDFLEHLNPDKPTEAHLLYHRDLQDSFHDIKIKIKNPTYSNSTKTLHVDVQAETTSTPLEGKTLESVTLFFGTILDIPK